MKPERGQYRSITVALLDGPDFQALPAEARWVFTCLKIGLGPSGIDVEYPAALVEKLAARTGYPAQRVAEMLDLLQCEGWVRSERHVVWIVKQLEFEPAMQPSNEKHQKAIASHVKGLPRLGIVAAFIRQYQAYLPDWENLTQLYPKPTDSLSVAYREAIHSLAFHGDGNGDKDGDRKGSSPTETGKPVQSETPHNFVSVMSLVISELYFGQRPSDAEMRTNGSVLKTLAGRWSYDDLAKIVQGLARQRAAGDLRSVGPRQAVSLKWLNDGTPDVDPCQRALDAFYRGDTGPPDKKRGGSVTSIGDFIGRAG